MQSAARLSILAFIAVTLAGILLRPLLPAFETRYLSVAWEMYINKSYLVPYLNGALYPHKPPLLFWLINVVWSVTGVSEFAARLVAPAFAVASLFLVGNLARRLWPEERNIGAWATIILASMSTFLLSGGFSMFDAMLSFATLLGMIALVGAVQGKGWINWVLLGVAIAIGVLSKGPVILLHLLPALLLYPLLIRAPGRLPLRRMAGGAAIALLVALFLVGLWLVPAVLTGGPEYRDAVLWTQSAGRVSKSFAHARAWWYYIAILPMLGFPWLWSPNMLRAAVRIPLQEPGVRLCLLWLGAALLLFSLISGKQPHYMLPEIPAIAILLARAIPEVTPGLRWNAAIAPIAVVAAFLFAAASGVVPLGKVTPLFQPGLVQLAIGLVLVALIWISLLLGDYLGTAVLGLTFILALNMLAGFSEIRPAYDSSRIARILAENEAGGVAISGQTYFGEFNFTGRLRKPIAELKEPQDLAAWIADNPDGVVVGRQGKSDASWSARETIVLRNSPYSIWFVADRQNMTPAE